MDLPKLRYVKLVGLEVEGAWSAPPPRKYTIIHDHSVCSGKKDAANVMWPLITDSKGKNLTHVGEIASEAMTLAKSLEWLKEYYPHGSNGSCGFHVHVSVRSLLMYRKLTQPKFWKRFLLAANKFGESLAIPPDHLYWWRLRGENRFCYKKFRPLEQMALTIKPQSGTARDLRRCMLNYCWAMHGTLECRLFPMWEKYEDARASVLWFVQFVENYLQREKCVLGKTRRRRLIISEESCKKVKMQTPSSLPPFKVIHHPGDIFTPHQPSPNTFLHSSNTISYINIPPEAYSPGPTHEEED